MGINGTRAMTAFNSKTGGFHLTTVGRVQTPTLAILVEREEKIRKFSPRDFWEVPARSLRRPENIRAAGSMKNLSSSDEDEHLKAERLWDTAAEETARNVSANRASSPRKASRRLQCRPCSMI